MLDQNGLLNKKISTESQIEERLKKGMARELRRIEIEKLVKQGYSQVEIGRFVGMTREGVRQYINSRLLYDIWKEAKEKKRQEKEREYKLKKEIISDITYILGQRAKQLAKKEGLEWEYEMALKYNSIRNRRGRRIPLERLLHLFNRYKYLKEKRKKESLEKLAAYSNISDGSMVCSILKKVELDPFYGHKRHKKFST